MPSIYHTPDGAILKTPDGNIIKEPYNFGNAFCRKILLGNNYLNVRNLDFLNGYSIVTITAIQVGSATGSDSNALQLINEQRTAADNLVYRTNNYVCNYIDSVGASTLVTPLRSIKLHYHGYSDSALQFNGSAIVSTASPLNQNKRVEMNVGACASYTGNTIPLYWNGILTLAVHRVCIFNRLLTLGELVYWQNNYMFNNPQSLQGLIHDYICNEAEIVSILGVDCAGIRDRVGSKHGEIMNLPAGTAQQKVDFANANLFVPFQ